MVWGASASDLPANSDDQRNIGVLKYLNVVSALHIVTTWKAPPPITLEAKLGNLFNRSFI
jgi:hypothetical protein